MGILPDVSFSREAPFRLAGSIKIETVMDGKYTLATPTGFRIPADVTKW